MKKLLLIVLFFGVVFAQEQSVYTLTGKKDSRLDARYTISYVATNLKEGCGSRGYTTGTMKPSIVQRSMSVPDENYTINLPIYMTAEEDKVGCGYRFGGLELIVTRKYDEPSKYDYRFSRFWLMGDYKNKGIGSMKELGDQRADVLYAGDWGGTHTPFIYWTDRHLVPGAFKTDKKYFRIAPETTFVCMSQDRIYEYERTKKDKEMDKKFGETDFMCTMQMKLDTEGGKYHYHECTKEEGLHDIKRDCGSVSNPDFGVDGITSDTLHINILVDESKCETEKFSAPMKFVKVPANFKEIDKPKTALDSLKSLF